MCCIQIYHTCLLYFFSWYYIRPSRFHRNYSSVFLPLYTRKCRQISYVPWSAISLLRFGNVLFLNSQSNRKRKLLLYNTGATAVLLGWLVSVSPPQHPGCCESCWVVPTSTDVLLVTRERDVAVNAKSVTILCLAFASRLPFCGKGVWSTKEET